MGQPIKIYVGNIPQSARNSELKELFEKFGKVRNNRNKNDVCKCK